MILYLVLGLTAIIQLCDGIYFDNVTLEQVIATQISPKTLWNETTQDKLKKDLFMNYDRYARPHEHFNVTVVKVGIGIIHVESNELKSTITIHTWLRLVWIDPKLKWNESDYGGVSIMRVADHEVWHPDLYLYNSALGGEPLLRYGNPNALIYPNGEVLFVPPVKQTVLCNFDLRHWPFDTQHCQLKYGSWVHNGNEIKLELYGNQREADLQEMLIFSNWNVSNSSAEVISTKYECCIEEYHTIQFNLTLVRNPNTYVAIIVTPAVVNTVLILMQCWLPPLGRRKVFVNGFVFVILTFYLVYFMDKLGGIPEKTPLIVLFYIYSLYAVCFGIFVNVMVVCICRSKKLRNIEILARRKLGGRFAKILLLTGDYDSTFIRSESLSVCADLSEDENDEENFVELFDRNGCFLGVLLNRLLFVLYLFIIFVVAVSV